MVKIGGVTDTSMEKSTQRIKCVCPHCGNVAFLDPKRCFLGKGEGTIPFSLYFSALLKM